MIQIVGTKLTDTNLIQPILGLNWYHYITEKIDYTYTFFSLDYIYYIDFVNLNQHPRSIKKEKKKIPPNT